jgi:hypothetical protein
MIVLPISACRISKARWMFTFAFSVQSELGSNKPPIDFPPTLTVGRKTRIRLLLCAGNSKPCFTAERSCAIAGVDTQPQSPAIAASEYNTIFKKTPRCPTVGFR